MKKPLPKNADTSIWTILECHISQDMLEETFGGSNPNENGFWEGILKKSNDTLLLNWFWFERLRRKKKKKRNHNTHYTGIDNAVNKNKNKN